MKVSAKQLKEIISLLKEEVECELREELEEKAPPGKKYEDMIKAMKREGDLDEPQIYAIAWSRYNKDHNLDEGCGEVHNETFNAEKFINENEEEVCEQVAIAGDVQPEMNNGLVLPKSHKDEIKEEVYEEKKPEDEMSELLDKIETANSMVTHDDPNLAYRMSTAARDTARSISRLKFDLEDAVSQEEINEIADEMKNEYEIIADYFIGNMTDEAEDYNSMSPEDQEDAGMYREEAYVFRKYDPETLGKAVVEFYSK